MRDIIIMAGGYDLHGMGASALRTLGFARLFHAVGYHVIVLGKLGEIPGDDGPFSKQIDGITCYDIRRPLVGRRPADYTVSAQSVMSMVDHLGAAHVRAVICYNYPARGLWPIIMACRFLGIAPILDCADWYGWEGKKILRNIYRLFGVELRMRYMTKVAGNVICASSWLQDRLTGVHTLLLPWVVDSAQPRWIRPRLRNDIRPVNLIYSGSPGLGMYKDRLPIMIQALSILAKHGHDFHVTIAGITVGDYLSVVPNHAIQLQLLASRINFLGRISHHDSLNLIRGADFSVFFRQPNRVSNTGFPTKYVEAATLGVPVITNATSDLALYLHDGVNGIMARSMDDADVLDALRRAITLTPAQRIEMVGACHARNPFDLHQWLEPARSFLANLRWLDE